ncbi:MAG: hypothetical protein J7L07_03655 [Candidatus Odinarchaeota archaeon]|nr:hypothetical protein [Candidatus Odinarchaeota archaeon]
MGQLKINIDDEVLMKFKQIVLAKRGKLEISREGEEAIRLYIKKYEHLLQSGVELKHDPLIKVIGAVKSDKRSNALIDLKKLEAGKL